MAVMLLRVWFFFASPRHSQSPASTHGVPATGSAVHAGVVSASDLHFQQRGCCENAARFVHVGEALKRAFASDQWHRIEAQ